MEDNKSETSRSTKSRRSTSSRASNSYQRLKEAEAKRAVAKLKAVQLKVAEQLEREEFEMKQRRRSLELQNELEQATLEAQIWKENVNLPDALHQDGLSSRTQLNPDATAWKPTTTTQQAQRSCHYVPDERSIQEIIMQQQQANEKIASTIKQGFVLPKAELTPFNGDPLYYWNFIRSFDNTIDANASSDCDKLMYLLQYCTGKAKYAVQSCVAMDPSEGYREARKMLAERFGDPYVIAMAHVRKVTGGQPLKSTERGSLLDFSDTLRNCESTLKAIGYLDEINSADNLQKIAERLPFYLKGKWLTRSRKLRTAGRKPMNFSSF